MSEAVARYWVHRCSRGEQTQPGSPCAALLWMNAELERLRAIEQRARAIATWNGHAGQPAAKAILGEEKP